MTYQTVDLRLICLLADKVDSVLGNHPNVLTLNIEVNNDDYRIGSVVMDDDGTIVIDLDSYGRDI